MDKNLLSLIREHYRTLQGYVSAGMEAGKDPEKIFMNANENPFALKGLETSNRYTQPQPPVLLQAYADLYGVTPDNIVATRGADEALVILTKLFCEPHKDSILITPPTFGMYAVDACAMPAGVIEVPLINTGGTWALDVPGIIEAGKKAKMVLLCSPNNPTGNLFARGDMLKICSALRGHAVVIADETYIEFSGAPSLAADLKDHPNLIILRTLSKSYALAGMRMGSLISGDKDFIALVRSKCLDAYPIPRGSIDAAMIVMEPANLELAAQNRKKLLAEKGRIRAAFEASKLVRRVYKSDANFILVEMEGAKSFIDYCAVHKIILRDFTTKPGTADCIRISPDLPENNTRLITLLKAYESEQ